MVCLNIFAALAILGVALPSTLATQWIVGDTQGWGLNVDYTTWASRKTFVVGDTLVFNYEQGSHDVVNVTGTDFQQCTESAGAVPLTSGHDVITLAVAGNHWYMCEFPEHCLVGMNLVVDVLSGTPAKSLSKYPAKSPPKYPTKSPLKSPAKSPPKSPSKSLPKSPAESPSESPIESPTESPTESPAKSPTESPTNSHSSGALAPHRQRHMVLRGH